MKKNNKNINIITLGAFFSIWIIYLTAHLFDFLTIFGILSIIYEFLISGIIYIIHYLVAIIRYSLSYIIIFLFLCLFCIALLIESGYTLKFWGIDLSTHTSILKFNYFIYFVKDYYYFLFLLLNLSFFLFVFYYGFFYNIFIIAIFLLFYLFLILNIYLKYIIKKNKYIINSFNFFLNLILGSIIILYLSLLSETISKEINYKIDWTEYMYQTTQRKDRFMFKFQEEEKLFSFWNLYKSEKFTLRYLYFKNIFLKNNILSEVSNNNIKYKTFVNNDIDNYYSFLNKEHKLQFEKKNLNSLNNNNNIYFENNYTWYNNNIELSDEIVKENISKYKNNLNWFTYLLNIYRLKWYHYISSDEDVLEEHLPLNDTMSSLLKLNNVNDKKSKVFDYSQDFDKINKDSEDDSSISVNYDYIHNKFEFINNLLLKEESLNKYIDNYSNYINFKNKIINSNIYKFDFFCLLKYKYNANIFLNENFLIKKKNSLFNFEKNSFVELRYQKLSDIINQILSDNFNVISYKYNYLLNWWEGKFDIKDNAPRSTKYDALNKYLITEKDVSHFNKNINIKSIFKGNTSNESLVKELNTNNLTAYLAPVDVIKKSIESVDRNIFYFNIYKDIYKNVDILNLNYKENSNYYYNYLFRELGLFKIKNAINVVLTFEKEKLSERYLSQDIDINKTDNLFWTFYRPANKEFYYFFDYNNNLSLVTKNVLYYFLENRYYNNMNIIKSYNQKLIEYNNGKWYLYFKLMGSRFEKFIYWYNNKIYENINMNFLDYIFNKNNNYENQYYNTQIIKNFNPTINKLLEEVDNQVKIINTYCNLYSFNDIDKVDLHKIKQLIIFLVNNLDNIELKEYFLKNKNVIDVYALYWKQQFYLGASIPEFIKFFKSFNINNKTVPFDSYKFYGFHDKFKLNKSDYWHYFDKYYKGQIFFSSEEEDNINNNLNRINDSIFVSNISYDTKFCMTLAENDYLNKFEILIKNFFGDWAINEYNKKINLMIKKPFSNIYKYQLKELKEWSNWVFDSYNLNDIQMLERIQHVYEKLNLIWDLSEIYINIKKQFFTKLLVRGSIDALYNNRFDEIISDRGLQLIMGTNKRTSSEINWYILCYLNDLFDDNILDDEYYLSKKTTSYIKRYNSTLKATTLDLENIKINLKKMDHDMVSRLLNIFIWEFSKLKEIEIAVSDSIEAISDIINDEIILEENVYILEDIEEDIDRVNNDDTISSNVAVLESIHKGRIMNSQSLFEWNHINKMLKLKGIEEIKNLAFEKKDVMEKYLLKKDWDNYNYQRNVQQKFNKNFKK